MDIERDINTDSLIDALHEPVTIIGITWDASRILFELDPIAYREIQADLEAEDED